MNKEDFINDLKDLNKCFKKIDYEFWIFGGVLLGHVRDGDFLPWDDEMDLGIKSPCPNMSENLQEEYIKNWLNPFKEEGFTVEISQPKLYFGWIIRLTKRIRTDLVIFEEYKSDLCYSLTQHYYNFPKEHFENMDKIKIGDEEFNIPTPVEEHFFLRYGTEWRIPKAPIVEKRKTLSKSEFNELYPKKWGWRSKEQCIWNGRDLRQEMIDYYNNIVYIAGCWDLFHFGHLVILNKAGSLGHKLIVGIVTDNFAEGYKGRKPIISYTQRKQIIGSLRCVYKVLPYDGKKNIEAYDQEKINVLVIGSDYPQTEIHQKAINEAKKRGIKIKILDITKGISSSIIKEKIKNDLLPK